ncbi:PNPLA domain-containing protein [Fusarium sp. LHS14.1]|nr:PNPLA domain-containing protein [Fusarium sp. LHS14.1]
MGTCKHTTWLRACKSGADFGLEVTDRPKRLADDFSGWSQENASFLMVIGNRSKQLALSQLGVQKRVAMMKGRGDVRLYASSRQKCAPTPFIIADTDVPSDMKLHASEGDRSCHQTSAYLFQDDPAFGTALALHHAVLHRCLLPFVDVVCVFVADLGGIEASLGYLSAWVDMGPPSVPQLRPRIFLVVNKEDNAHCQARLVQFFTRIGKAKSANCFDSISIMTVPFKPCRKVRQKSEQSRKWGVVRREVFSSFAACKRRRRRLGLLFSVRHTTEFMTRRANMATDASTTPFEFIKTAREYRQVSPDLATHLSNVLTGLKRQSSRESIIPFIASSLIFDHYVPNMHSFDPTQVFQELYLDHCYEAGLPNYEVQRHFDVKIGTSSDTGGLSIVCLDILGWTVEQCMAYFEAFASRAFAHKRHWLLRFINRIPLLSEVLHFLELGYILVTDSKYSVDGLRELLQETCGHRSLMDSSQATKIGSHVAVTLTKSGDGSVLIATNYNGVGSRSVHRDYHVLRTGDDQPEVPLWKLLLCSTAAPFYFPAECLGNLGTFQDGGVAYNNPSLIAVQEAAALFPGAEEPSMVVSLGTGSSSGQGNDESWIKSKFVGRLKQALWWHTNPDRAWKNVLQQRSLDGHTKYYRLDVKYNGSEPRLDEVGQMGHIGQMAEESIQGRPILHDLSGRLRAELFYFELDEARPPHFSDGSFHCVGHIMCRLPRGSADYRSLMEYVQRDRSKAFRIRNRVVEYRGQASNQGFLQEIEFTIPNLTDNIVVQFLDGNECGYDISGSPFTLRWLVRRQGLDTWFGTADHHKRESRGAKP